MTFLENHHSIFETNLNALRPGYPNLVEQLVHHTPSPNYRWIETDTTNPTLELELLNGVRPILYHSRHDPVREAERQIESLELDSPSVFLFAGLGLGYSLEALWENHPRAINALFLVERDLDVFYYFLHRRDWSFLLSNPCARVILTDNPEKIIADAQPLLPHIMGSGIRFVDHRPSFQCHPIFYTAAIEKFRHFLQRAAAESEFLIAQGSLIQRNAILNLPAMCSSHGLGPLRGYFRNQPAVLIGAGPSLNKNIEHLISERSKVLVFCVDTAYRLVRERGIVPDFVAATDPTELNVHHFDGVEHDPREVLIFESDVHPDIPRNWGGSSIFLNSEKAAINRWIEEIAGPFGSFEQGLSVGHTLYTAAEWMQCNPIILIGFDLAYPPEGGHTHAEGTIYNRRVEKAKMEDERVSIAPADFHPQESHERIEWVLGVRGDRVPTSPTMAVFLHVLSDRIKHSNLTVFDATEGGALIEGSIPSQLSQVLSNLENKKSPGTIVPFLEDHRDPQEIRRLEAFDALLAGLQDAHGLAKEGWNQTQEFMASARDQDADPSSAALRETATWKEIDGLFWRLYRNPHVQTALGQALFPSLFLFIRQEKDEPVLSRLEKYANVFGSIVRLSDEFIPYLQDSRERIALSCTADAESVGEE